MAAHRFFTVDSISFSAGDYRNSNWSGTTRSSPADGSYVHGIEGGDHTDLHEAVGDRAAEPGLVVFVEAAEALSQGDQLATDANGRARAAGAGDVLVATALEGASGAGDMIWAVLESQRQL